MKKIILSILFLSYTADTHTSDTILDPLFELIDWKALFKEKNQHRLSYCASLKQNFQYVIPRALPMTSAGIQPIKISKFNFHTLKFSPDGRYFLIHDDGLKNHKKVFIFDIQTNEFCLLPGDYPLGFHAIKFSADSRIIAVDGYDAQERESFIRCCDVHGNELYRFAMNSSSWPYATFIKDHKLLVFMEQTVYVIDVDQQIIKQRIPCRYAQIIEQITLDNDTCIIDCYDKGTEEIDLKHGQSIHYWPNHYFLVAPDRTYRIKYMLNPTERPSILYKNDPSEQELPVDTYSFGLRYLKTRPLIKISPDSDYIVIGSGDTVTVCDREGTLVTSFAREAAITNIKISAYNSIVTEADYRVQVHTMQAEHVLTVPRFKIDPHISKQNNYLLVKEISKQMLLYDISIEGIQAAKEAHFKDLALKQRERRKRVTQATALLASMAVTGHFIAKQLIEPLFKRS